MGLCGAPGGHPVDVLPDVVWEVADEPEGVDVGVEELEDAVDAGKEGAGVGAVAEVAVVIADLEDPVEGEPGDDLRDMGRKSGLCEAFRGDGRSEVRDGLSHEAVVTGEQVVEQTDRAAVARVSGKLVEP